MSVDFDKISVVQWYDSAEKHRCGYCKNQYGSISNGMWAETLTVEDYQNLINRGWRRSGKYCYKPIMHETCCPQYTIRCDTSAFLLSKSQKKNLKKFNRYLEDGDLSKKDNIPEIQHENAISNEADFIKERPNINLNNVLSSSTVTFLSDCLASGEPHNNKPETKCTPEQVQLVPMEKKSIKDSVCKEGVGKDPNKPPCKKAKLIRLERKKEKLLSKGITDLGPGNTSKTKTLEEFIDDIPQESKHKLQFRLVPTSEPNSEWEGSKELEFALYSKYQMTIHNDPPSKLNMRSFSNFLVNSPLKPEKFPDGVEGPGYGSFHQQYWLDEKLIAVGVVDILPKCVSSVYFFYDPDYRSLTLGTLGALREVHFTRRLTAQLPELRWYYMGFYIHSCPKMRYKGKLAPSYLLCPESYVWVPMERCVPLLDAQKYSRLNADIDALDENMPNGGEISKMKIVYNNTFMDFNSYKKCCRKPELREDAAALVGAKCTRSLVFWI